MAKSGLGRIYKRRARSSCITCQRGFGHLYILVPGGKGAVENPAKARFGHLYIFSSGPGRVRSCNSALVKACTDLSFR